MELGDLPRNRTLNLLIMSVAILAIMELGDLRKHTTVWLMVRLCRNPRYNGIG